MLGFSKKSITNSEKLLDQAKLLVESILFVLRSFYPIFFSPSNSRLKGSFYQKTDIKKIKQARKKKWLLPNFLIADDLRVISLNGKMSSYSFFFFFFLGSIFSLLL